MTAFSFVSFGVGITVEANQASHVDRVRSQLDSLLAGHVEWIEGHPIDHVFSIRSGQEGAVSLFLDDEEIGTSASETLAFQYLGARIKLAVGASTRSHVVVHAGVVGVGERAVVLPAHSFQGKTTLVRELVSRGAAYYSDDLAIFDRQGLVHPFPKPLSLRGIVGQYEQTERTAESLGGVTGEEPLRVGMVVFTSFAPNAEWHPRELSPGRTILKLFEHTQNVRSNPQVAMEVLGRVVNSGAVLWESERRDAGQVADHICERLAHIAVGRTPC